MKDMQTAFLTASLSAPCCRAKTRAMPSYRCSMRTFGALPASALSERPRCDARRKFSTSGPTSASSISEATSRHDCASCRRASPTATILAVAGLKRLGLQDRVTAPMSIDEMLPAVAQGVIGLEIRGGDETTAALIEPLNDAATA